MKQLLAITLLLAVIALQGCQRASVVSSVAAQTTIAKAPRDVHFCAGITKSGEQCKKHVKAEGDYCWIHAGQKK